MGADQCERSGVSQSAQGDLPLISSPARASLVRFKNTQRIDTMPELRNFIQMSDSFRCKFVLGHTDSTGTASAIELPMECGHAVSILGVL